MHSGPKLPIKGLHSSRLTLKFGVMASFPLLLCLSRVLSQPVQGPIERWRRWNRRIASKAIRDAEDTLVGFC